MQMEFLIVLHSEHFRRLSVEVAFVYLTHECCT